MVNYIYPSLPVVAASIQNFPPRKYSKIIPMKVGELDPTTSYESRLCYLFQLARTPLSQIKRHHMMHCVQDETFLRLKYPQRDFNVFSDHFDQRSHSKKKIHRILSNFLAIHSGFIDMRLLLDEYKRQLDDKTKNILSSPSPIVMAELEIVVNFDQSAIISFFFDLELYSTEYCEASIANLSSFRELQKCYKRQTSIENSESDEVKRFWDDNTEPRIHKLSASVKFNERRITRTVDETVQLGIFFYKRQMYLKEMWAKKFTDIQEHLLVALQSYHLGYSLGPYRISSRIQAFNKMEDSDIQLQFKSDPFNYNLASDDHPLWIKAPLEEIRNLLLPRHLGLSKSNYLTNDYEYKAFQAISNSLTGDNSSLSTSLVVDSFLTPGAGIYSKIIEQISQPKTTDKKENGDKNDSKLPKRESSMHPSKLSKPDCRSDLDLKILLIKTDVSSKSQGQLHSSKDTLSSVTSGSKSNKAIPINNIANNIFTRNIPMNLSATKIPIKKTNSTQTAPARSFRKEAFVFPKTNTGQESKKRHAETQKAESQNENKKRTGFATRPDKESKLFNISVVKPHILTTQPQIHDKRQILNQQNNQLVANGYSDDVSKANKPILPSVVVKSSASSPGSDSLSSLGSLVSTEPKTPHSYSSESLSLTGTSTMPDILKTSNYITTDSLTVFDRGFVLLDRIFGFKYDSKKENRRRLSPATIDNYFKDKRILNHKIYQYRLNSSVVEFDSLVNNLQTKYNNDTIEKDLTSNIQKSISTTRGFSRSKYYKCCASVSDIDFDFSFCMQDHTNQNSSVISQSPKLFTIASKTEQSTHKSQNASIKKLNSKRNSINFSLPLPKTGDSSSQVQIDSNRYNKSDTENLESEKAVNSNQRPTTKKDLQQEQIQSLGRQKKNILKFIGEKFNSHSKEHSHQLSYLNSITDKLDNKNMPRRKLTPRSIRPRSFGEPTYSYLAKSEIGHNPYTYQNSSRYTPRNQSSEKTKSLSSMDYASYNKNFNIKDFSKGSSNINYENTYGNPGKTNEENNLNKKPETQLSYTTGTNKRRYSLFFRRKNIIKERPQKVMSQV